MAIVHPRVFLAAGAWLLGVVAATGGSLAAVSLIGQSIGAPPTQQLTVSAVSHALASGKRDAEPSAAARPSTASGHRPTAGSSPVASGSASTPGGTLISSAGGSVLAGCAPSGAYLISWSPQQGYAAGDVVRGPATVARVVFLTGSAGVSLTVTCAGSVPSGVASQVHSDDGGGQPGDN